MNGYRPFSLAGGNGSKCPIAAIAGAASQPRRRCGQLVIRFGAPEGKSEDSYLLHFHLLNTTGGVWLNP